MTWQGRQIKVEVARCLYLNNPPTEMAEKRCELWNTDFLTNSAYVLLCGWDKKILLGYVRGTLFLILSPRGKSPDHGQRVPRAHARRLPPQVTVSPPRSDPSGASRAACGGVSSVSSPSDAGSATLYAPTTRGSFSARLLFYTTYRWK